MPKINNLHLICLNRKAFTLIELMISVSIMAIIGISAIPIFMGFGSRQYPKETAKNLISSLNLTKSKAYSGSSGMDWFIYMLMGTGADGNPSATEYSMYDPNNLSTGIATQKVLGDSQIIGITLTTISNNTINVSVGNGLLILFNKVPDLEKGKIYHLNHSSSKLPICSTKPWAYTCAGSPFPSPIATCTSSWGLVTHNRYCDSQTDTGYECSCWSGVDTTDYTKAEILIADKYGENRQTVIIEQQQPSGNLVYRIEPTP